MSYDLEIWSVRGPGLPDALPSPESWTEKAGVWVHAGRGWQIVVEDAIGIDVDDVPEQIGTLLPGIAYLTRISLEPGHAPKAARQLLQRTAKNLAKAGHGVVHDPQEGSMALGSGVKKFTSPGRELQGETLMLSWWFGPNALATKAGFQDLVELLRKHMPEALPKRYGTYEPPEHRLSETGEAHLVEFLASQSRSPSMVVLYPNRPVTDFQMALPDQFGQSTTWNLGFRANMIYVQFHAATLQQPGWERQIQRFWRQMSEFLQPFYGDVRFLPDGQDHPVRSWFWRGFPSTSGVAAVIGRPYLELWPQFADARKAGDSLAYFGTEAWREAADIFEAVGGVPADLINPNGNYWSTELYPSNWPFDLPG